MHDGDRFSELPTLRDLREDLTRAFADQEQRADVRARTARRRRIWAVSLCGLAVVAGAVVVASTSGLGEGGLSPQAATAAEALGRVARVAEATPAPFPRDDEYFYVESQGTGLSMFAGSSPRPETVALVTNERKIWTSIDRPGRLDERMLGVTHPNAKGKLAGSPADVFVPPPGTVIGKQGRYHLGLTRLTREEMLAYPTDPQTIYDRLRAGTGGRGTSPAGEVFAEIGDALRKSPAPAGLRGGLYRALALVPGVQLVGDVKDRLGRDGVAVAFTAVGVRHELVFDATSSEILAEREILVSPAEAEVALSAGSVIGDTVYVRRAVVDQLPAAGG